MKKLVLLLLAIVPAALFAQEKYTMKGNIGSISAPAKVFLTHYEGTSAIIDSTSVTNGVFTLTGEVKDITRATLTMDYRGVGIQNLKIRGTNIDLIVYLVNGTTAISSPDSLRNANITGTKVNEDYQRFLVFAKPNFDAIHALNREFYAAIKGKGVKEAHERFDEKYSIIDAQYTDLKKQFIAANPDSYYSLLMLKEVAGPYPDVNVLEPEYNKLSKSVRATTLGVAYQKYINSLKTVTIGQIAPEFTQADTNGKMVSLSSFRGKYVLLDFWASWCPPCRAESPNMVKAYNNFKGTNFTILSVSLDQPGKKDAWLKAIHDDHLTWTQVSDLKLDNETAKLYGIKAIPQNFLIGPSGKIIAKDLRGSDLDAKLTAIFGKM